MPDTKSRVAQLEALKSRLTTDRSTFDDHWRDLADFLQPRRTRWYSSDRNKGDKRNQKIIDSTGRFAARTLASGLHAGLTSPARPWMKLTTPDPGLAEVPAVREWLHVVTQRMLTIFLQSNLYNALPVTYLDMGVFGTAAMSVLEDSRDLFRAYTYPIGSYALGLDARGVASTFVREYELTVRQVVEQFAWDQATNMINRGILSNAVKNAWDRGDYEDAVTLTWMVLPNVDANPRRLGARFLPYSSYYWESSKSGAVNEHAFLRESGFNNFPVLCPRWDVTGEDSYGTDCPGMTALGDVKQLQIMQKRKAQAIAKMVDPPLSGPTSLMNQKTSLIPGDITYVDVREGQQGLRAIHEVNLSVDHLMLDMQQTQYRIQRAFYEDLFLMLAMADQQSRGSQPVTAREIEERHEEKLLALGPVLERTNDELLDPLIDRVYGMMDRAGLLPDPPEELIGVDLKVEYISIMAQAQKLVGVVGQDRFVNAAMGLVSVFPEARHKIDTFQLVDNYGDMLGVDPRVLRPNDEAQGLLDAERQAQLEQMQAEQMAKAGQGLAAAGKAPIAPDSPLDRVLGQGAGAPVA